MKFLQIKNQMEKKGNLAPFPNLNQHSMRDLYEILFLDYLKFDFPPPPQFNHKMREELKQGMLPLWPIRPCVKPEGMQQIHD